MDQHQGSAENSINDSIDILHTDIVNQNDTSNISNAAQSQSITNSRLTERNGPCDDELDCCAKAVWWLSCCNASCWCDSNDGCQAFCCGSECPEALCKYLRLIFASKELLFLSNVA